MSYPIDTIIHELSTRFPGVDAGLLHVLLGDTLVEIRQKTVQFGKAKPPSCRPAPGCNDNRYRGTIFMLEHATRSPCELDAVLFDEHWDLVRRGVEYRLLGDIRYIAYSAGESLAARADFEGMLNAAIINSY